MFWSLTFIIILSTVGHSAISEYLTILILCQCHSIIFIWHQQLKRYTLFLAELLAQISAEKHVFYLHFV